MTKKLHLYFYHDPGHGWLAVKKTLLDELGIAGAISGYSYMRGRTAYLEEDCDMTLFCTAARAAGWELAIEDRHTDATHPIRSYSRYQNFKEMPL